MDLDPPLKIKKARVYSKSEAKDEPDLKNNKETHIYCAAGLLVVKKMLKGHYFLFWSIYILC